MMTVQRSEIAGFGRTETTVAAGIFTVCSTYHFNGAS
jgi:hypothetical protein